MDLKDAIQRKCARPYANKSGTVFCLICTTEVRSNLWTIHCSKSPHKDMEVEHEVKRARVSSSNHHNEQTHPNVNVNSSGNRQLDISSPGVVSISRIGIPGAKYKESSVTIEGESHEKMSECELDAHTGEWVVVEEIEENVIVSGEMSKTDRYGQLPNKSDNEMNEPNLVSINQMAINHKIMHSGNLSESFQNVSVYNKTLSETSFRHNVHESKSGHSSESEQSGGSDFDDIFGRDLEKETRERELEFVRKLKEKRTRENRNPVKDADPFWP